jgi:N-sulfoglucosamine sulfohydrolase
MAEPSRTPNILWISTHDISPHLGAYAGVWPGAEHAETPHLDRLAADGALFEQAFAAAPVCSPSRSAIITGCYPTAIGTMHMRTKAVPPPEVRLLPEYLRMNGYYCTNNVFTDFQVDVPGTAFDDCSPTAHWRNRADADTPFFAAFHGMVTHESSLYVDDDAYEKLVAGLSPDQRRDPAEAVVPPYYPDTEAFRKAWCRYLELITVMDAWVGDLLDQLEEDGLTENTIVVFWSDHGIGMPRAKRFSYEAGLHEPLIVRWPGHVAPGSRRSEVVELMDLAPTMLTACGVPIPAHMHASALFDADGEPLPRGSDYAFGGRDRMGDQWDAARTARDASHRYIRNLHPDRPYMLHNEYTSTTSTWRELRSILSRESSLRAQGEIPHLLSDPQRLFTAPSKPAEELYNLIDDPHEVHNLAADDAHRPVLERMRAAVDDWTNRVGDLGTIPEDELLESWRPGGRWQRTATPTASIDEEGVLTADCATEGALIGWTTDPAPAGSTAAEDGAADGARHGNEIGSPPADGRTWTIFQGPVTVPPAGEICVTAWRLGFLPSAETVAADLRDQKVS